MNLSYLKLLNVKLREVISICGNNKKLIIISSLILVISLISFKFFYYDGIATCKPMKYKGTIIGVILGNDLKRGQSRKEVFDQMVPVGMLASDLMALLKEQKIKVSISHIYKYTKVPPSDYVISFRTEYICIEGDYLPGFRVWIKDNKVYIAEFYVERSFI